MNSIMILFRADVPPTIGIWISASCQHSKFWSRSEVCKAC